MLDSVFATAFNTETGIAYSRSASPQQAELAELDITSAAANAIGIGKGANIIGMKFAAP